MLAYLRELREDGADETILCVSNLSRTAQAVELDLSAFAGRVPVDIVGGSVFPPVGQLTYLLTLPPYGFYWFLLASRGAVAVLAHAGAGAAAGVCHHRGASATARGSAAGPGARQSSRREVLPAYLPKRRWFAAKGEKLQRRRASPMPCRLPEQRDAVLLAEIEVELGDRTERYALPLGDGLGGRAPAAAGAATGARRGCGAAARVGLPDRRLRARRVRARA